MAKPPGFLGFIKACFQLSIRQISQARAKSSTEYIQERITTPNLISGKGVGESKLVNGCACEDEVVSSCSEQEHHMNRRTEFIVFKSKYKLPRG